VILDCYRLARFYGQSPGHFLEQPLSAVARHVYWTDALMRKLEESDDR